VFDAALCISSELLKLIPPKYHQHAGRARAALYWANFAVTLPLLSLTGWHLAPDSRLESMKEHVLFGQVLFT
jgi:hypothetical protein